MPRRDPPDLERRRRRPRVSCLFSIIDSSRAAPAGGGRARSSPSPSTRWARPGPARPGRRPCPSTLYRARSAVRVGERDGGRQHVGGRAGRRSGGLRRVLQEQEPLAGARRRARRRGSVRVGDEQQRAAGPALAEPGETAAVSRSFSHRRGVGARDPELAVRGAVGEGALLLAAPSSSSRPPAQRSDPSRLHRPLGLSTLMESAARTAGHERLPAAGRRDPAHPRGAGQGAAARTRLGASRRLGGRGRVRRRRAVPRAAPAGAVPVAHARCGAPGPAGGRPRPGPRSCSSAPTYPLAMLGPGARAAGHALPGGRARLRVLALDRAGDLTRWCAARRRARRGCP